MEINYNRFFTKKEIKEYEEKSGHWLVANIKQQIGWPESKKIVEYKDRKFLLLPETKKLLPCIAFLNDSGISENEVKTFLNQYLSSISWIEGNLLYIHHWTGGGPHPVRMGKSSSMSVIRSDFRYKYLPDPPDKKSRLALALYREAISLENVAYSFLSFYKIINLKYKETFKQKEWIKNNLGNITDERALNRIKDLTHNSVIVSDYLYKSCRCAISHAGLNPTYDPDNYEDEKRLHLDLPIIRNLSEILIESEFGVKSRKTFYNEHIYELYGFKKTINSVVITNLKKKNNLIGTNVNFIDRLSIRIFSKKHYIPFESLKVVNMAVEESKGILYPKCVSSDSLVQFTFGLDFPNEKLKIFPFEGINIFDNESKKAAIYWAEYYRFLSDYFGNGELEIWDLEQNKCLSQCDPYIPVNIDLTATIQNFIKSELKFKKIAKSRRNK